MIVNAGKRRAGTEVFPNMTDYRELRAVQERRGVASRCLFCRQNAGMRAIPVLLPGADLNGQPLGMAGQFDLLICKHCGCGRLVDPRALGL